MRRSVDGENDELFRIGHDEHGRRADRTIHAVVAQTSPKRPDHGRHGVAGQGLHPRLARQLRRGGLAAGTRRPGVSLLVQLGREVVDGRRQVGVVVGAQVSRH